MAQLSWAVTRVTSPCSLAIAIGLPETPKTWKVSIWSSGKARPMPSASTTGLPVWAATTRGMVELIPPHSMGMVAVASRPRCRSRARSACTPSPPEGIFSTITVGAPIIAVGTTSAWSGTSSRSQTVIRAPWRRARSTMRRPT